MTPESPLSDSPRLKLYYAVFGLVSTLVVRVFGYRRAVMRGNLERSFPDLPAAARRDIEREFVRRQAEVLAEIAFAPHLTADELRRRVTVVNPQVLENARPPRPIVLAGAHQCNWEWMLLRVSLELGPQLLALYKPIRNPRVDAWFRNLRARFGANLIAAKSVLQELARFREARGIGLLADQVPKTSPEKHWLEFLHQDTAFYQGPELLARALRSQVVCIKVRRLARGRYEIEFAAVNEPGEKLAGGTLTERYARHLEAWIREDPAGWWWAHKRWKLKRPVY